MSDIEKAGVTEPSVASSSLDNSINGKGNEITMRDLGATVGDDEYFEAKPGYRLNWMADSGLDFETYGFKPLDEKHQLIYKQFSEHFQKALKDYKDVDKTDKYYQDPDEYTMLRFLQADDYNISKATNRLLQTLTWRQKSGFEKFVTTPNRNAYKLYSALRTRQIIGVDKFARPFLVERTGDLFNDDPPIKAMSTKLWLMCYAYDLAQLLQACRETSIKHKKLVHNIVYLSCLKGTTMWGSWKAVPFVRILAKEVEMHFPELVGIACMVNANTFTEKAWSLAKIFLDKNVSC